MKKNFLILALSIFAICSCSKDDKEKDFPIVGNLSISGECSPSMTRPTTWIPSDSLGVFVTSDGKTQSNLLYLPSKTAEDKSVDLGGELYHMYGSSVGNVALKPNSESIGFKQGNHVIYAYYPYKKSNADLTKVEIADLSVQDDSYQGMSANPNLSFGYAIANVAEYSVSNIDLGAFKSKYTLINTGSISFKDDFVGKTITSIEVSCKSNGVNAVIAYKNPVFDFTTEKIVGEECNSIKYNCNMKVESSYFGPSAGPAIIVIGIPYAEAKKASYTFKFTFDNGTTLEVKDTTPANMEVGEGSLSFYDKIKFE